MSARNQAQALLQASHLSLAIAQIALQAALDHASKIKVPVNIAIYSDSLHQLAFARMDEAKLTSIDIAHNKAYTAAGHRLDTGEYGVRVEPGGALYGVQHTNDGRFCTIRGGLPIMFEGVCLGGIGVSGGTPDQDKEIASMGVQAVTRILERGKDGRHAKL